MTDAECDELRGKVQEVSYEMAKMEWKDGNWKATTRMVSFVKIYDQEGRQLVSKSYASNKMFGKTVYLEVDGVRAMKSEITRDGPGTPPMLVIGPPVKKTQKPDPRYEIKYLDTYDERGNRTEVVLVSNDGRILSLLTYKFDENGNQIEWAQWKELDEAKQMNQAIFPRRKLDKLPQRTLEAEGKKLVMVRNTHYVCKYDAEGKLTDSLSFDDDGKVSRHVRYAQYEFDTNKNWIRRASFLVIMKDGKEELTPEDIEYQVIKYHP